jgi:hypothetical protein
MPCPDCGASVPRGAGEQHICDEVQRTSYEADQFDTELDSWLASPSGRFAVYYAERERRLAA